MKRIKVAMVGAWGHGAGVLSNLDKIADEVEIVGLAKVFPEDNLQPFRDRFGICRDAPVFDNSGNMLAEVHPQVVIVSTRLDRIAFEAIAAAEAECHLICEKPLAVKHEDLDAFEKTVKTTGVQCIAILDNCAHPVMRAARKAVQDGLIGDVVLCNARKSYKFGNDRPAWFGKREFYGGTIPWIGIHGLDFILSATDLRFKAVAAMQDNFSHPEYPDCEDNCALTLKLNNGGHATVSVDYLRPAGAPSHGDDWLRIVGTRGIIEAYMARNTCTLITDTRPPAELPLPASINYFAGVVRDFRNNPASLAETTAAAFHLTKVALLARDSADQRKIISV